MTAGDYGALLAHAWLRLKKTGWHWFNYHFYNGPRPFADSILRACGSIDDRAAGIGTSLLDELCSIGGREKDETQYEQLLQKLAEILVIERIVQSPWPEGTTFEHEPAAVPGGPRPELLVRHAAGRLVVEVKTPSLLGHIRARAINPIQLPYRGGTQLEAARSLGKGPITLPRDNPVRDFLRDAERKFTGFRDGATTTLLVIVWDDFIYEPISVLVNPGSGLLTNQTYSQLPDGTPETFPNVDAVVAIRHLDYFIQGSREARLPDRQTAMDFGAEGALPNVLFQAHGGRPLPDHVVNSLRAVPHDHPGLRTFAEYHPQDMVMWINTRTPPEDAP
ncbi:hypothetical protein [Rhizobium leguminosarum]